MDKKKTNQGGRKPKNDKANFRYTVNFTEKENAKFMGLFRQSSAKGISKFIAAMIFGREMKVVKIDKANMDYYMRLTSFYSQFQAVGVNYNQTVKAIKSNFSEKRALILLSPTCFYFPLKTAQNCPHFENPNFANARYLVC